MRINRKKVEVFADFLKSCKAAKPFDFYSAGPGILFPEKGSPIVTDYFFSTVLHQFGFWYDDSAKYIKPMYITVDNRTLKGSDYMWYASLKAIRKDSRFLDIEFLSKMELEDFKTFFLDDDNECRLPMIEEHYNLKKSYAEYLKSKKITPSLIIRKSLDSDKPLRTFLDIVNDIPGYMEDPLHKKANLLALTLYNRPEKILNVKDTENWKPVVDYHIQRSMLRTGMLEIPGTSLVKKIENREILSVNTGEKIRLLCYEIINILLEKSGRDIGTIDYFFFRNRKACPEMEVPDCPKCIVKDICAKKTKLFQPVYRTTFY